ncbi:MAG TPA: hypothetical protein DCE23_04850 [Firmicutes bacterium]|nr:hypothetical protein [Bacillota bacterium]
MSKWGIEEKETLDAMKKINFKGYILNVAAGDGRFNNMLLKSAEKVIAIDISDVELTLLKDNCEEDLKPKLQTKIADINKPLPFKDETFDGIFCTGTLHLFKKEMIINILHEMKRVLKRNGKIILDFATDIRRIDKNGNFIVFENEGNYHTNEATEFFKDQLSDFDLDIQISTFTENNLDISAGYNFITGSFLVISAIKH